MSWITLTEAAVLTGLTGPEMTAIKTAALGAGQSEPLTATIAKAVQDVHGYVAANAKNRLGLGDTIPSELEADAIALVRYRAFSRLPVKSLITPSREQEYKDALSKFKDVARDLFRIEQPVDVSPQIIAGPAAQVISTTTRQAGRRQLSGL